MLSTIYAPTKGSSTNFRIFQFRLRAELTARIIDRFLFSAGLDIVIFSFLVNSLLFIGYLD